MSFRTLDPSTGERVAEFPALSPTQLAGALDRAAAAAPRWAGLGVTERADLLRALARMLRVRRDELAGLATLEMGKLLKESVAEVEKCAWVCDYDADHGPAFLEDESIASDFGLGSSVWTRDTERGERLARRIQCSGYGRELSRLGIHEFVNAKTVWLAASPSPGPAAPVE